MIENLKRIREPVAWGVIAIIGAGLLLGIVRLVLLLTLDKLPLFAAFQEIGLSIMNLSLVIALIGMVCACLFLAPATTRSMLVARVGAIVVTTGAGLQLVCMGLGVAASTNAWSIIFEVLGGLLDVALKAVGAGVLWILLRGVGAGRLEAAPSAPSVPTPQTAAPVEPAEPPIWLPDEAAGTVWRTAADAAAGERPVASGRPDGESADSNTTTSPGNRWHPVRRSEPESKPASKKG